MFDDAYLWVHPLDQALRCINLGRRLLSVDGRRAYEPIEIGQFNAIGIHENQASHAEIRELLHYVAPEAAEPDDSHRRGRDPSLAFSAEYMTCRSNLSASTGSK